MIIAYRELFSDGYVLCLPGQVKLSTCVLGSYINTLKVTTEKILLKAVPARIFLEKGYTTVDDNGTSLTLLDADLDKKLVVISDFNLYFALRLNPIYLDNVWVEVMAEFPKNRK